jgi:hypothetical protein
MKLPLFIAVMLAAAPVAAATYQPAPASLPPAAPAPVLPDGARAFDFEFGNWTARIARRLKPLTGSTEWVEYEGSSVVRPWWDGRANIGELRVSGPAGKIEGMSVRLYDPAARQWRIHWASSADGQLGEPMIGGFEDGRGLFYNQEMLGNRAILVRFIFSGISPRSFRIEQAFSADGGKSWETNWISDFTKVD